MYRHSNSTAMKWCLSESTTVHWAEWENSYECVIYIDSTGETILGSVLSITLLEAITCKPQTLNNLVTNVQYFIR